MSGMGSGSVGLMVVGLGGVGSSLIAGICAARSHLVHPFGTLAEAGGTGRPAAGGPAAMRETVALVEMGDLALGAFELREDDAYRAALRAGNLDRALLDEMKPELRRIRTMAGARQAPTRRDLADALAEDMRGFLAHHHCARGVVVCTLPGLRVAPGKLPFTPDEVWKALEDGADWVTPGLVYAAAAAQAGCSFVAAGRDAVLGAPGLPQLFADAGVPIAGTGLLGPDAALREALAQVLAAEGLVLGGAASLSTRAEERGARLWGGPDRTQEMGVATAWGGGALELSLELRGQVALYLAGRAFDATVLVELAARAGRTGAQDFMDALFAAPLGASAPRPAGSKTLSERRARIWAELPSLAQGAAARSAA